MRKKVGIAAMVGATLFVLAAMGASASGMLSAKEMSMVRGGCGNRCKVLPCGTFRHCYPKFRGNYCDPQYADQLCMGTYSTNPNVNKCWTGSGTGNICYQLPQTIHQCGVAGSCSCTNYVCGGDDSGSTGSYYACQ
jgi:hypothetical protein